LEQLILSFFELKQNNCRFAAPRLISCGEATFGRNKMQPVSGCGKLPESVLCVNASCTGGLLPGLQVKIFRELEIFEIRRGGASPSLANYIDVALWAVASEKWRQYPFSGWWISDVLSGRGAHHSVT